MLSTTLSKEFWFAGMRELEVDMLADIEAFVVQILMLEEKWHVLIGISREFTNLTWHCYGLYLLPFTIHA